MSICAQWCLQDGMCLAVIPVLVFPPAGAAAAGIDVWLGEGAHVGTSGRSLWAGVAWGAPGPLPRCSHVLCQMGLTFPWKCVTPAPDAGSLPNQLCRSGDGDTAEAYMTWIGAAHS